MSANTPQDTDEHDAGIQTPRQLITVVAAAFIVPILVIVLLAKLVTLGNKPAAGSDAFTPQAVAERIAPLGRVTVNDPSVPKPARSGQQVFEAQCTICHGAGLLGAPKFGDSAAWAPHIARGFAALLQSALHGKGNMPAQGGGQFNDDEIARAVVYMANRGGARFDEPPAPAPTASAPVAAASR